MKKFFFMFYLSLHEMKRMHIFQPVYISLSSSVSITSSNLYGIQPFLNFYPLPPPSSQKGVIMKNITNNNFELKLTFRAERLGSSIYWIIGLCQMWGGGAWGCTSTFSAAGGAATGAGGGAGAGSGSTTGGAGGGGRVSGSGAAGAGGGGGVGSGSAAGGGGAGAVFLGEGLFLSLISSEEKYKFIFFSSQKIARYLKHLITILCIRRSHLITKIYL